MPSEGQQLRLTRLEDALERHQRAKERFLAAPVAARPAQARAVATAARPRRAPRDRRRDGRFL